MSRGLRGEVTAALGLTTIVTLYIELPLVGATHSAVYHWSGTGRALFVPALIDFFLVWVVLTLVLVGARGAGRGAAGVWSGLAAFLPWIWLKNAAMLTGWNLPRWVSRPVFGLGALCVLVVLVLWRPAYGERFARMRAGFTKGLTLFALWGVVVLGQLAWFGWQARALNAAPGVFAHRDPVRVRGSAPRIVWILFDELSFEQVYARRYRDAADASGGGKTLHLPAFDALAGQSTSFTHVAAAGLMTENVMPALFEGKPVDRVRSSADGRVLELHRPGERGWQEFDQRATIFEDALRAGYRTGVAGWYNPYCRILPEVLDECFWTQDAVAPNMMLPGASILRNVLQPVLPGIGLVEHFLPKLTGTTTNEDLAGKLHTQDYERLRAAGDRLLEDPSVDFVMLHMPIPHPGGIYDRAQQRLSFRGTSYLDNLALADVYLGHVRTLLEAEGQWDSTAVVIMGDHSWRTKMIWSASPVWTKEDALASRGGRFDDRPAYVVKMPGQATPVQVTGRFSAVETRGLMNSVMTGQVRTGEQLRAWAEERGERRLD